MSKEGELFKRQMHSPLVPAPSLPTSEIAAHRWAGNGVSVGSFGQR